MAPVAMQRHVREHVLTLRPGGSWCDVPVDRMTTRPLGGAKGHRAHPGQTLADIHTVYPHPRALAQGERFLATLNARIEPSCDTAGSARRIAADGLRGVAAVASRSAATAYGGDGLRIGDPGWGHRDEPGDLHALPCGGREPARVPPKTPAPPDAAVVSALGHAAFGSPPLHWGSRLLDWLAGRSWETALAPAGTHVCGDPRQPAEGQQRQRREEDRLRDVDPEPRVRARVPDQPPV